MNEELKAKIDEYVKGACLYYRSTHEDMLPNQFEKYLRKACVYFATENGIQWHRDRYSPSGKDKYLPCGKVEGYYRVILYDNYREPQIVRPESEIEFIGNQREHIIVWGEIPQFKE